MKIQPTHCKTQDALSILFGKWKPTILLFLMSEGTMRNGELKRALVGITPKMLSNQLRELEQEGLISREVYPQIPPKVEYSITEYGLTLKPILDAMHEWGTKHINSKMENVKH